MNKIGKAIICGFIILNALPVSALENKDYVSETVTINAPPSMVWEAITAQRSSDPEHRKVVSSSGSDYVVEEKFSKIPVLGNVVCRYTQHETSGKKLEYKMISSDKFIAFEGVWDLKPLAGGQTSLTLSSFVDTGLKLPFVGKITRDSTKKSVAARLSEVDTYVDSGKKSRIASISRPSDRQ